MAVKVKATKIKAVKVKKKVNLTTRLTRRKNNKKGEIITGTLYVIVFLVVVATGAFMFMGGTIPQTNVKPTGDKVIIISPTPEKANNNLQLLTFFGITLTPTTPPPASADLQDCGSNPDVSGLKIENTVLVGYSPSTAGPNDILKVWYSDEHPLTLGVNQTNGTSFSFSKMTKFPADHASPVQVGDLTATDIAGVPIYPSLFLSDITTNPNNKSGDWQNGGKATPADDIFGSWKAMQMTTSGGSKDYTSDDDSDPNINGNSWGIDGGDQPPAGNQHQEYGAEARWNIQKLISAGKIVTGHTYRAQFFVHDGDQTQGGGDLGQGCATIRL